MGTKSFCSGVDEERVDAPNQDGVQLRQRFVAHQKELCSLNKKTEELELTLKMQSAEIKRLQKLTEDSEVRTMCGSRTGGWSLPCVMSD
jgi:hypothetical protein